MILRWKKLKPIYLMLFFRFIRALVKLIKKGLNKVFNHKKSKSNKLYG